MPLLNDPAIWFKEIFIQAGISYSFSSFLSTIALVLVFDHLSHLAPVLVIWFIAGWALKVVIFKMNYLNNILQQFKTMADLNTRISDFLWKNLSERHVTREKRPFLGITPECWNRIMAGYRRYGGS